MPKQIVTTAVEALIDQFKMKSEADSYLFFRYLEEMCDRTNDEAYILTDLPLLANILLEKDMRCLIDFIALYDFKAAQQLELLT
ncbi:hypothetical protein LS684_18285 [Cytobacillus spongiae]|uniref:hypothetical protein n=1 Tax=Cytobacillus spongiae TaxID=2901381 RepID=UPI001F3001B3|nr:hypothetical protein [Cytobacillus spongiae]UII55554.1 hypothetical protein LS684_18285 [Cytobacillus spongiae]